MPVFSTVNYDPLITKYCTSSRRRGAQNQKQVRKIFKAIQDFNDSQLRRIYEGCMLLEDAFNGRAHQGMFFLLLIQATGSCFFLCPSLTDPQTLNLRPNPIWVPKHCYQDAPWKGLPWAIQEVTPVRDHWMPSD